MGDLRVLQMSRQSLDWPRHRVLHKSPHLKSLRPFAAPIKANAALFDIRVALVRRLLAHSHSSPHSSRIYRSRIVQHNFVAPSRRVALRRDASRSATRFAALNPNRYASHHSARSSASHHKLRSHASRRKSPAVLPGAHTGFSPHSVSLFNIWRESIRW